MNKILKYFLVFVFLFLMNIFIFKILATLGFQLTMSEKSYIVPPLFSIIVVYMIDKRKHVVIMAGGVGSRFWPMSTTECPKQFIDRLKSVVIFRRKINAIALEHCG